MKHLSKKNLLSFLIVSSTCCAFISGTSLEAKEEPKSEESKEVSLDEMWKDDALDADKGSSKDSKKSPESKSSPKLPATVDTDTDFKIEIPKQKTETSNDPDQVEETDSTEADENTDDSSLDKSENKAKSEQDRKVKALCTLSDLKSSVFVKQGGWPGVGPFKTKSGSENVLVDDHKNSLNLLNDGGSVKEANLRLVNKTQKSGELLSLQMTTNFLLEALGAQNSKIADFNSRFEEKGDGITQNEKLILNAGSYEIEISKSKNESDSQEDGSDILISVKNTELEPIAIATPQETAKTDDKTEDKTDDTATDTTTDTSVGNTDTVADTSTDTSVDNVENSDSDSDDLASSDNDATDSTDLAPAKTTSVLDTPIIYDTNKPSTTTIAIKPPETSPDQVENNITDDDNEKDLLKRQFNRLISTWQIIKHRAVKNRQKENLTRILGGKALQTQSRAIEFLLDKHRYYEMTPESLSVESYKAITPDKKYEVVAKIKERRRYIDADTLNILKDEHSSYTVTYIVEQIRGQWLIVDSKAIK